MIIPTTIRTAAAIVLLNAPGEAQNVVLSELLFQKPPNSLGHPEFIEIAGPAKLRLEDYWILCIAHGGNSGVVSHRFALGSYELGANGLLLLRSDANVLLPAPDAATTVAVQFFSPSLSSGVGTIVLGQGSAPPHGTDLDHDNDGVLDLGALAGFTVVDVVGRGGFPQPPYFGYADDLGFPLFGALDSAPMNSFYRLFHADGAPCSWAGGEVVAVDDYGPFVFDFANDDVFGFADAKVTWMMNDPGVRNMVADADGDGIANSCDPELNYANFVHHELGGAKLSVAANELTIGQIWLPGSHGARIDLPQRVESFHVAFSSPIDPLQSSHREIELSATGALGGIADSDLGTAAVIGTSGVVSVRADFSASGATTLEIVVIDRGEVQGSSIVPSGGPVATVVSAAPQLSRLAHLGAGVPGFVVGFASPVTVHTAAGGAWIGDEVRLIAVGAVAAVDHLTGVDLLGYDLAAIIVDCESALPSDSTASGCPGSPSAIPRLFLAGCPRSGRTVTLQLDRALPHSVAVLQIGSETAPLPLGAGCSLGVFPILATAVVGLDGDGAVSFSAMVPPLPAEIAVSVQAFVVDPLANPLGAAASNSLRTTLAP